MMDNMLQIYRLIQDDVEAVAGALDETEIVASRGPTRWTVWKSAAESGSPWGQYLYGKWLDSISGRDAHWYRLAAEQGNALAQIEVGYATEDAAQANAWFRRAAEQGNAAAQEILGYHYLHGFGVDRDDIEAITWLRRAAQQGDADHQMALAGAYMNHPDVQDFAQAFFWYRKAAEQGNAWAQVNLGSCYFHGKGVSKDAVQVVNWCRKAADRGAYPAMNSLGHCYYFGNGVEQDFAQAASWYRKAAEQGYSWAAVHLGDCYANGNGVALNVATAFDWYRMAQAREREIYQPYQFEWLEADISALAPAFSHLANLGRANEPYTAGGLYRLTNSGYFSLAAGVEEFYRPGKSNRASAGAKNA
jgi:TPR repeat protein